MEKGQHDDRSDRSILGYEQGKGGVIVQNDVTISYHERGDEESVHGRTVKTSVV